MRKTYSLIFMLACALGAGRAQRQTFSVLDTFQNFPDGASPYATLYRDSAGNLYGTTAYGGNKFNGPDYNHGVVFKLDANGRETVLHNFTGGLDGGNPYAGVVMDSAGNLYGTTFQGGIGQGQLGSGAGVVFKIDQSGHYSVLYSFTGGADGSGPASNLILDAAGYLYGTTAGGGPQNYGVVFKISPSGQETVLYSFTGGSDGLYPSGVTADAAENLYGTTLEGGEYGTGVVFKLSRSGQLTVLHTFGQYGRPSGVILDAAGNLYGGAQDLVYKLDPAGNLTALAEFDGSPSELVRDTSGNLYFTSGAPGSVYKLETNGNLKSLYTFTGIAVTGLSGPNATPVMDAAGNLYGTSSNDGSAGIVYEIEAGGTFKMLYNFQPAIGGTGPYSGVTLDAAGNLFGTTNGGGIPLNLGVVYKLSPDGQETVLHSFQGGGTDGANPVGNVVLDQAGDLYGVTTNAGADNHGVVYKLSPTGGQTILHSFAGGSDGIYPFGLARDAAGNLYGAASGGGRRQ